MAVMIRYGRSAARAILWAERAAGDKTCTLSSETGAVPLVGGIFACRMSSGLQGQVGSRWGRVYSRLELC